MGRAHRPERSSQRASARSPEGPGGARAIYSRCRPCWGQTCSLLPIQVQYMHRCICEPRLVSITDSEHLGAWSVFLSAHGISIQNLGLLLPGLARCETSKMNGEGRCTETVGEALINTVCCLPSRVLRAGPASFPWIVAAGPGDGIHSGSRRGSHARGSMSILSQSQLPQFCAIRYVPTLSTFTSMQCRTVQWEVRCAMCESPPALR